MKKIVLALVLFLFFLFFFTDKASQDNKPIANVYPWQIEILSNGYSRVFGLALNESTLKDADKILMGTPAIALYESKDKLTLEAYYKNISLGGLIGSFIFTLDASEEQLAEIKKETYKRERTETKEVKHLLDKFSSLKAKKLQLKNLIYIPRVQLDQEMIMKRFGKPTHKIKLKTKEVGWHYLYPEKGLDLIYKKEGKEILQYVSPKNFNLLLEPLLPQ